MPRPSVLKLDVSENKTYYKAYHEHNRSIGRSRYCPENYDCIENYELAKADNFDPEKWQIHHRLEYYWTQKTLKEKDMYYNVSPFDLIWLRYEDHQIDIGKDPEVSTYHKHILEHKRGWKNNPKYIKCEGKHQLESDDQRRAYQREYHREWYYKNKERHMAYCKAYNDKKSKENHNDVSIS